MNKSTNMLFMMIMLISVPVSISSNSWFIVWMGMEINIMAFIPLIIEQKNMMTKESALTYFLVQTIASMLMILSFIINNSMINMINVEFSEMMLISTLMMKSGVFPFHFWMPKMMEGMTWNKCLILMTWQKITPMMMMSNIIKINYLTMMAMAMTILIGGIGGLNQTSLRKMMAYSSISNNGWMMMAMMMSEMIWMTYFMFYCIMTIILTKSMNIYKNYHINQMCSMNESTLKKFILMMNMLSMSGLPPMMGFIPKWLVIQTTMSINQLMMLGMMVMMMLITIYYYIRIMFSVMMLTNYQPKWIKLKNNKNKNFLFFMNTFSILGLYLVTLIFMLN
uniref:NADH-ubiquinone oxidoreductase chain 2 n=1 Tax=Micadina phluctainoides TaxID=590994 RepID=E2RUY3_MICPD|nr:NADH dehydrogenase subunit 2 [Micadina phluctainoides]BAJ24517.1 NADH dehydrogenase subunit 2 [Micadina phluctainoides]